MGNVICTLGIIMSTIIIMTGVYLVVNPVELPMWGIRLMALIWITNGSLILADILLEISLDYANKENT